jgi:hypothetical protein
MSILTYIKPIIKNQLQKHQNCIIIFGIVASIISIPASVAYLKEKFWDKAKVEYSFTPYISGKLTVYTGKLINRSSYHAKDFFVKGAFKARIIDAKLRTNDPISSEKKNEPIGSYEVHLKQLSGKSECGFDILVDPKNNIREPFRAVWGNDDQVIMKPTELDPKTLEGAELEKRAALYNKDISRRARQKWLDLNSKVR